MCTRKIRQSIFRMECIGSGRPMAVVLVSEIDGLAGWRLEGAAQLCHSMFVMIFGHFVSNTININPASDKLFTLPSGIMSQKCLF